MHPDKFTLHLKGMCVAGEASTFSDMDTAAWTQELKRIQSRAAFQRLELERLIQSMRMQVLPAAPDRTLHHEAAAHVCKHL